MFLVRNISGGLVLVTEHVPYQPPGYGTGARYIRYPHDAAAKGQSSCCYQH